MLTSLVPLWTPRLEYEGLQDHAAVLQDTCQWADMKHTTLISRHVLDGAGAISMQQFFTLNSVDSLLNSKWSSLSRGDGPVGNMLATQGWESKSDLQNQGKEARQGAIISALGECPGQQCNLKTENSKSTKEIRGGARSSGISLSSHIWWQSGEGCVLTQKDHKFNVSLDYRVRSRTSAQLRIMLSIEKGGLWWGRAEEELCTALVKHWTQSLGPPTGINKTKLSDSSMAWCCFLGMCLSGMCGFSIPFLGLLSTFIQIPKEVVVNIQ